MMMKDRKSIRWIALLCFLLMVMPSVNSDAALSLDDVVAAGEKSKDKEASDLPPDVINLDPSWWNYFNVDSKTLQQRIVATEDVLTKLTDSASPDEKEKIQGFVQRILINLKSLPAAKDQTVSKYLPPPFRNTYSLEQQFELVTHQKDLQALLSDGQKEVSQLNERAKKVRQHIDSLYANYIGMHDPNEDKAIAGLEIISLRMALATTEEGIRVNQERVAQISAELAHTQEELKQSLSKLTLEKFDEKEYAISLQNAQVALRIAQSVALSAEMSALGKFGDSPSERANAFYTAQLSVQYNVESALAAANVIFIEAKRSLLLSKEQPKEINLEELVENIEEWQLQMKGIQSQVADWETKTTQEYEKAIQPVSTTEGLDEQAKSNIERIQKQRLDAVQVSLKILQQLKLKILFNNLMIEQLSKFIVESEGTSSHWYTNLFILFDTCCDPMIGWLYTPLLKIGGIPLTVVSLLRVILIVAMTFGVSKFLQHLIRKIGHNNIHLTEASLFLVSKLIHYIILCLGFALAFASIGLNLSNLAIVLGALSVGIGFGLQTIVNNLFSSLIILFSRTIKVGDIIELSDGKYGQVAAINIQNTIIHLKDGIDIVVPNSEVLSNKITNWTLNDNFRRLRIPFSVAYGTDKELVSKAAIEAAEKVPCTVRNSSYLSDPQVWLVNFGDNALEFELVVWVNVYGFGHKGSMKASYNWELDDALKKYKIDIPFPQREVHVYSHARSAEDDAVIAAAEAN